MDSEQRVNGSRLRPDQDEITVRLPALRRYVSSIRSLTTGLAAQCELTVDEIEDIQISIDEACTLLLQQVGPSRMTLELCYRLAPGHFSVEVRVEVPALVEVDRSSLPWTVLSALTEDLELTADGQSLTICFSKRRQVSRS